MSTPPEKLTTPFAIASYMCHEYSHNAVIQQLLAQVAANVRHHEELVNLEKSLQQRKDIVETLNFTLEMIHDSREMDQQREAKSLTAARNCYDSFIQLNQQLQLIDLQKIAKYDVLVDKMAMKKEFDEMIEYHEKTKAVTDSMEQRLIVQKLRKEQKAFASAQSEYEKAVSMMRKVSLKEMQRLEAMRKKTNQLIVQLIRNSKDIGALQNQLKNGPKTSASTSTAVKDSIKPSLLDQATNPMSFLNSIFESNNLSSFFAFGNPLDERKHRPPTALLSTLHPQHEDNAQPDKNDEKPLKNATKPKRVHFLLSSDECSEEPQRAPPLKSVIVNPSIDTLPATQYEGPSTSNSMQESQRQEISMDNTEMLNSYMMATEESEKNKTESDNDTQDSNASDGGNYAQILECRIIKPVGTPLPKVLPVSLSPESAKVQPETSKQQFKIPQAVPKKSKDSSSSKFFDDLMDQAMSKGRSSSKKSHKMNFLYEQEQVQELQERAVAADNDFDEVLSDENAMVFDFESDMSGNNFGVNDSFTLDFMEPSEMSRSNNFL